MAKINFDPELMRNIKIIYGDANLDGRTLKQLYQTWKTNPEIIKRTAQQKMPELKMASFNIQSSALPNSLKMQTQEIANDDLSRISSFDEAFNIANQKNLKTFIWKKTKANPSGLYAVITDSNKPTTKLIQKSKTPVKEISQEEKIPISVEGNQTNNGQNRKTEQSQSKPLFTVSQIPQFDYQDNIEYPNLRTSLIGTTWGAGMPTIIGENQVASKQNRKAEQSQSSSQVNNAQATINRYTMGNTVRGGDFGINRGLQKLFNYFGDVWNSRKSEAKPLTLSPGSTTKFQQGGAINNQQELQKAFMAYLIQDAQAQGIQLQSEQDLQAYAKQLGEKGLKAKYQEFIQKMQGGVMAKFGAKLEYIRKLKGICPEGYELKFFKQGGSICKVCEKGEKLKQKEFISKNDTVHVNGRPYDLTGKHKQYPKLTNDKYRKLPTSKQTDIDLKDQARKDKCGAKLKKKKK